MFGLRFLEEAGDFSLQKVKKKKKKIKLLGD
jgi:hypothetical protein